MKLASLSNDELRASLMQYGENVGPIDSYTRHLYENLLKKLEKGPSIRKDFETDYCVSDSEIKMGKRRKSRNISADRLCSPEDSNKNYLTRSKTQKRRSASAGRLFSPDGSDGEYFTHPPSPDSFKNTTSPSKCRTKSKKHCFGISTGKLSQRKKCDELNKFGEFKNSSSQQPRYRNYKTQRNIKDSYNVDIKSPSRELLRKSLSFFVYFLKALVLIVVVGILYKIESERREQSETVESQMNTDLNADILDK